MKTKQTIIYGLIAILILGIAILSCNLPTEMPREKYLGSIKGRVMAAKDEYKAGIIVTLEKTDGPLTQSVIRTARDIENGIVPAAGQNCRSIGLPDSISAQTETDKEGWYSFANIEPGTYTFKLFKKRLTKG